jgi:hypothetical protein
VVLDPMVVSQQFLQLEVLFADAESPEDGGDDFNRQYFLSNDLFRECFEHNLKQKLDFVVGQIPINLIPILLPYLYQSKVQINIFSPEDIPRKLLLEKVQDVLIDKIPKKYQYLLEVLESDYLLIFVLKNCLYSTVEVKFPEGETAVYLPKILF